MTVLIGLTVLVVTVPPARAATWTEDSDTDFNAGTFNGIQVVGTGLPATLQLSQDATDWTNESPAVHPSAREATAMAYDSANNLVVLFGGYNGSYLGDTWVYDPDANTWTLVSTTGPSGRFYHAMAYDSANNLVVLFGGANSGGFLNDTWEYSTAANTWTQRNPVPSPPLLESYHLAYYADPSVQRSVLAGRNLLNAQMVTWAYDAGTHSWTDRAPSPNLPVRVSFAMGYHAAIGRVVQFGGLFPVPPPGTLQSTTYEYDWSSNGWTLISIAGPSARTSAGFSYRSTTNSLELFGGDGSTGPLADTWRYFDNPAVGGRQWTPESTQRNPDARSTFGFADQASGGKSVLFGGILSGGSRADDTWSFGPAYQFQGYWFSRVFNTGGANTVWNTIAWVASVPANTSVAFQLAVSNDPSGPWSYGGPNCQATQYFTTSGDAIPPCFDNNRFARILLRLITFDNAITPALDSVTIDYTVPAASPYIVLTDPANVEFLVQQDRAIFVRFSEQMDTATLQYTINPPITTTDSWSEGDSAVTINHVAPLPECKPITVTVTQARDLLGNDLVANPFDPNIVNPWTFVTECVPPVVAATNPSQGQSDVPLTAPVVVDFSENMNASSVGWSFNPPLSGVSGSWSNGTQRLTLTHTTAFSQCQVYTVSVSGEDLAGNALIAGPAPNPWDFQAHCTNPFIVSTIPTDMQTGVSTTANIVVEFSEPMVPATVTYTINPLLTLSPGWTNGNRTLTLTHGTPFSTCTVYTVQITGGKDADEGFDLQAGPVPNPWEFMPTCPNPFILFTTPADGDTAVNTTTNITVVFSEAMNTLTVTYSINPTVPLVASWNPQNVILTLTPSAPYLCGPNTVQILTGRDQADNQPLVPGFAPNPWTFTPDCPNPYIQTTSPANDATGVLLTADVIVGFNKPMDTASVSWLSIPSVTFDSSSWSGNNTTLTLRHSTPFAQSTQYTMVIMSGNDTNGNPLVDGPAPNPWRFTTVAMSPWIVSTDPIDGAINVLNGANVVVTFSEGMDNTTVVATPTPLILFTYTWTNNNTVLTLSHFTTFADCTQYTIDVTGKDPDGNNLVAGPVPNPWSFTTQCLAPFIVDTNPTDGATDVPVDAPIWVNFSRAMDRANTSAVAAPPITFTYSWSNGDRTLQLTHASPFAPCTTYTITVSGKDTSGNNLIPGPAPNPWSFTTACPSPTILSTVPPNGASNVPTTFSIVVTFSLPMNTSSVGWTIVPPATGTTSPAWTGGDTILTLTFSQPQAECTQYQVTITGNGANGRPLSPGIAPNPWQFSTICTVGTPGGLTVTKTLNAINLTWRPVVNADYYYVYHSSSRLAAWPWPLLANTTATSYDATTHLGDGNTHYYLVRAVRGATQGLNSTMGVKIQMNVQFSATTTNVWWFSLPYRTGYARASDIANELGPTRVDVIAKWNAATQSSITYVYFRGQWRGTDFAIAPGDGLWIGVRSAFGWVIAGTDSALTMSFTVNPPPLQNFNWRGIPYTGTYALASDLVRDIEGGIGPTANTRIIEVAKWNPTTQTLIRYFWAPSGWTGTDFAINPGDGIYFRIVASFTWPVRLVTPEVP